MKLYVYDFAEFLISNVSLKEDSVDCFELQGVSCDKEEFCHAYIFANIW